MEILVDLVGHNCWDWCVALDKISFGFKLGRCQLSRVLARGLVFNLPCGLTKKP
jgi:hypothetical protein